jgi:hypothetical protein
MAFDAEYPTRAVAIQYCGSYQGGLTEEIIGRLTALYERETIPTVRQAIVWCLRNREDLLPLFLNDPHEGVRGEAVLSLGRIGSMGAATALLATATREDGGEVTSLARRVLSQSELRESVVTALLASEKIELYGDVLQDIIGFNPSHGLAILFAIEDRGGVRSIGAEHFLRHLFTKAEIPIYDQTWPLLVVRLEMGKRSIYFDLIRERLMEACPVSLLPVLVKRWRDTWKGQEFAVQLSIAEVLYRVISKGKKNEQIISEGEALAERILNSHPALRKAFFLKRMAPLKVRNAN